MRSSSGVYPAVDALKTLAVDVKAVVGIGTKLSYAADWTEYGAHVFDGGAEVRFPLDALWASSSIDFVGIDVYWPLSDWRDGDHLDRQIADTIYDLIYLGQRITSGEAYDWYYADDAARAAQTRLPIADGASVGLSPEGYWVLVVEHACRRARRRRRNHRDGMVARRKAGSGSRRPAAPLSIADPMRQISFPIRNQARAACRLFRAESGMT